MPWKDKNPIAYPIKSAANRLREINQRGMMSAELLAMIDEPLKELQAEIDKANKSLGGS